MRTGVGEAAAALNISDYTLLWLCCSVVYSFVTFYLLKTYHSVIRHSTLREIAKFVVAVIGKELLLGLTILLYPPTPLFGMHMLALLLFDLLLTLCGLILIRVAMIIVYDLVKNNLKSRKQRQLVLVYGLSEKSVSLVTRLQSSPHYKVVGFLTFGRRMKTTPSRSVRSIISKMNTAFDTSGNGTTSMPCYSRPTKRHRPSRSA